MKYIYILYFIEIMSPKHSKLLSLSRRSRDRDRDYLSKFVIFITWNKNNTITNYWVKYLSFKNTEIKLIINIIYLFLIIFYRFWILEIIKKESINLDHIIDQCSCNISVQRFPTSSLKHSYTSHRSKSIPIIKKKSYNTYPSFARDNYGWYKVTVSIYLFFYVYIQVK